MDDLFEMMQKAAEKKLEEMMLVPIVILPIKFISVILFLVNRAVMKSAKK